MTHLRVALQLFTLTLAHTLGLEHDVICSDIQYESICKFGGKQWVLDLVELVCKRSSSILNLC